MEKSSKVVQALKVLQEEGREDLLRDRVLEQAWVGFRRPKRVSSEGVVAAVIAYTSLTQQPKKFRQKSVAGGKIRSSPERVSNLNIVGAVGLPAYGSQDKRGETRFAHCLGTSIRQRVVSRGRGALLRTAVAEEGRLGEWAGDTHVLAVTRVSHESKKKALLPSETTGERGERSLEERLLGDAFTKVAHTAGT
ncbi:hypothetical protein NDU88_002642 [Pleurodeles waltl]|uniref:Uncharacterized protein n=1 Tax=Pleurodeles waltl TaxID=8319 RepID=A0AAV7M333_PLEWA|nr:hypothetical protein NDU88_002642 [Pleurodeles waltl]